MEACRVNAQDLYDGAKGLREKGSVNIAYHLATLALEELGKSQLIGMRSLAKDGEESYYDKQLDDHIKKLFWALWGRVLGAPPTRQDLDQLRGTATIIHHNRLRGIYVEPNATAFVAPKDAVTDEMLDPLMKLAEAQLALQPSLIGVDYDPADIELLNWFSHVTDDPEKRRFIFRKESFDKLEAVGSRKWLTGLKAEIDQQAAEVMAALQQEMARGFTAGSEGQVDKWQIKIRFHTQSHSIRPKPLKQWNDKITWLKLYPVSGKKDQLDAIVTFPKFIPMNAIYQAGYGYSCMLLMSLNIASDGLFWWHQPRNLSHYYESLIDLENQLTGKIGRNPELKLGWPQAVLEDGMLDLVIGLMGIFPQPYEPQDRHEPMMHYLAGIGLMAKTDVFLQFEPQAYGAFLSATKAILIRYHDDLGPDFPQEVPAFIARTTHDDGFKRKHTDLIAKYEAHKIAGGQITLTEVAELKRLCSQLLIAVVGQRSRIPSP